MDGHLTFREHVSTFWRKTAPPLPRPSRCWWKTMPVGPVLSPGQSQWTLCWAEAPSASSSTSQWSGMGPVSHYPARHHNFRSIWMVICWKWQPKQVGQLCVCLLEKLLKCNKNRNWYKTVTMAINILIRDMSIPSTWQFFQNSSSLQADRNAAVSEASAEHFLDCISFCSWQLATCMDNWIPIGFSLPVTRVVCSV